MKESEKFLLQKYGEYLPKAKIESLNRFLPIIGINDISDFYAKIEKEVSTFDTSNSAKEAEDSALKGLANSDWLYSIETDYAKRELDESEVAIVLEGEEALILLIKSVIDRLAQESQPIGVKIKTLIFIESLSGKFALYNFSSPPKFLGEIKNQIQSELERLKLLESQKTLLDYFPISDNDRINQLFIRLHDEGYTDKPSFPSCSEFVPRISEFSETQKIDNRIDWKQSLQELVCFSYLLYQKDEIYKGIHISKILPELFTNKGKSIKAPDILKRLSDVRLKLDKKYYPIPKKWKKLSDIVSEISS